MDKSELKEILKNHSDWQKGEGGHRANLQYADLRYADLQDANLRNADLRYANLRYANLRYADLQDANLRNANLRYANLQDANLRNADLRYANLRYANLRYANLRYANLQDANLRNANLQDANLRNANLRNADLRNANLRYANLRNADLRYANLRYANLRYADLQDANLRNADLRNADLQDASNFRQIHQSNLSILKFQKGKLRAFKYLVEDTSPYQAQIYEVGKIYETDDFDTDERVLCGKGLNVATLDWCLKDAHDDAEKTYIEVEFHVKDIVAIPYNSDGKFRVRKLKVIKKLSKSYLQEYIKPLYQTGDMLQSKSEGGVK